MASKAELASDITFIETPPAKPSTFETGEDCGVPVTDVSLLPFNAPAPHLKYTLLTAAVVTCHP